MASPVAVSTQACLSFRKQTSSASTGPYTNGPYQCGGCTVLIDGKRVLSCFVLGAAAQGEIIKIEGLSGEGAPLHPMQQAFIECDAFQCGYCTPGQIMSAIGCVNDGHAGSDDDIREYMSGALCRCAAYPKIVKAVKRAKPPMERA